MNKIFLCPLMLVAAAVALTKASDDTIYCGFENTMCHFDRDDGDRNTQRARFGKYSYHINAPGNNIRKNTGFGCNPDQNYSVWFNDVTGGTEANAITIKQGRADICTIETHNSKFRSYHEHDLIGKGYKVADANYTPDAWYWLHISYADEDGNCHYTIYNSDGSVFWTWTDYTAQTDGTVDKIYSGSHNWDSPGSTHWDEYPYYGYCEAN